MSLRTDWKGAQGALWGDGDALCLDSGGGSMGMYADQNSPSAALKVGAFYIQIIPQW